MIFLCILLKIAINLTAVCFGISKKERIQQVLCKFQSFFAQICKDETHEIHNTKQKHPRYFLLKNLRMHKYWPFLLTTKRLYYPHYILLLRHFYHIFNNFYQSQRQMFGLCHNVEIIHEHHHHFYQLIVTPNSRKNSTLSKLTNPESNPCDSSPFSSPKKNSQINETHASTYYHSKRSYLGQRQRGIEMVCNKGLQSFQYQKAKQSNHENQQNKTVLLHNQTQLAYHLPTFKPQEDRNQLNSSNSSHRHIPTCINQNERLKLKKSQSHSSNKSYPSTKINFNHTNSNKTASYFNCHQLRQSKLILQSPGIYQTKKKSKDIFNKNDYNISVNLPLDPNRVRKGLITHQTIEIPKNMDKDSILTKRQFQFFCTFKTQKMFDAAKSITSRQSLNNSHHDFQESMIINRSMDCFVHITPERQLSHCSIYLAKDQKLNWIVCIRFFEFKHEQIFLNQSNLYSYLAQCHRIEGIKFALLDLYKIMVEGTGLQRTIYFILEPYEMSLEQQLDEKKGYYRVVDSALNYFVQDVQRQLISAIVQLGDRKILLIQPLELSDIVIVNEQYKFHSLSKFSLAEPRQSITLQTILDRVEQFKRLIIQAIKSP